MLSSCTFIFLYVSYVNIQVKYTNPLDPADKMLTSLWSPPLFLFSHISTANNSNPILSELSCSSSGKNEFLS